MMLLGDPGQFQLFVIASMVYSFALVPILLTRSNAPKPISAERIKFSKLFTISPVGVVGTMFAGMSNASLVGMGPIFAREIGLSIAHVSSFKAAAIFGGMILQFPMGRYSDRFDRRSVLIFASFSTALCALGVVWAIDQNIVILISIVALYGGFSFAVYPISAAQINDMVDRDKLVQVSAGLLIAYGIGASIGPLIAAQIMAFAGPNAFFFFFVVNNCLLVAFTLVRIIQRRRHTMQKAPFMPLGGVGVSSKQLYAAAVSAEQALAENTDTQ
jgi:MFS family permease